MTPEIISLLSQVRGSIYFNVVSGTPATQIPILLIVLGVFTLIFGVIGLFGSICASKLFGRIILGLVSNLDITVPVYSSLCLHSSLPPSLLPPSLPPSPLSLSLSLLSTVWLCSPSAYSDGDCRWYCCWSQEG